MQQAVSVRPEVTQAPRPVPPAQPRVVLVGAPNVGKSALFNALTGTYVVVSNYPGTTVDVSRGKLSGNEAGAALGIEVIDTPGMYSLLPVTEEERLTQRILLFEKPDVIVHVVDAKALERMLPLTLRLRSLGRPLLLVVNMMDEAKRHGLTVDLEALREALGIPVVEAVAVEGKGIDEVRRAINEALHSPPDPDEPLHPHARGGRAWEAAVQSVSRELGEHGPSIARETASLLLEGDTSLEALVPTAAARRAQSARSALCESGEDPAFTVARHDHQVARAIVLGAVRRDASKASGWADRLGTLLVNPWTGIPALLLVLYFGLYQFVGVFGAGTLVDVIENDLFGAHLNPWVDAKLLALLPGESGWMYWTRELFGGDYGVITLGITYAVAIVLPIVSLFFLFFSVLEDSGYFPRLAMLVDRVFKRIGLNGRAVIPVVLGFACDTMATLVTRVQETKRERVITTFLLALAVPCSAQYGVMAAILAGRGGGAMGGAMSWAFLVWAGMIALIFLLAGRIASKAVPGTAPSFYMELPPMRLPRPGAVLVKTLSRMKWYFMEILPLFVVASLLIWAGRLTGVFGWLTSSLVPVVRALGLPDSTSEIFLYGFFRRDFGAAGLYDLSEGGALTTGQVLVASVALTLFMPCVAQVLVMARERGAKTTAAIAAVVIATAFGVGFLVRQGLELVGMMS